LSHLVLQVPKQPQPSSHDSHDIKQENAEAEADRKREGEICCMDSEDDGEGGGDNTSTEEEKNDAGEQETQASNPPKDDPIQSKTGK